MNRVQLSLDEAAWFSRNVIKTTQLLEVAATKDPAILDRSTYRTLASIVPQVVKAKAQVELKLEKVDVMLSRKQKLIVKQLIQSVITNLKDRVIPEYQRRGESHKEPLDNAVEKAHLLEKMVRKLK